MGLLTYTDGTLERRPSGANAAFGHRSTMGEVASLSTRGTGFESLAVDSHRSSIGKDPRFSAGGAGFNSLAVDLKCGPTGPLIGGPGRAKAFFQQRHGF